MNNHELYSNWNKLEFSKHDKNVVSSLESFILFLKLDYFLSYSFFSSLFQFMIANNFMNNSYSTRKKCNQYLNYFFDMQILKPVSDNTIQNINLSVVVYSHKLLYKLRLALQRTQIVIHSLFMWKSCWSQVN